MRACPAHRTRCRAEFGIDTNNSHTRLVAALAALALILPACDTVKPEPPPGRRLPLGNGRKYQDSETRKYKIEVARSLVPKVPNEAAARAARLVMVLEETVTKTEDGTRIQLKVVEATAEGDDAEAEKQAALSRTLFVDAGRNGYSFEFPGESLGTDGELRIADVGILAHMMAPAKPRDRFGRRSPPSSVAESSNIPTGWSDKQVRLSGSTTLSAKTDRKDRTVIPMKQTVSGLAALSMNVVDNPQEASQGADPVLDGYFRHVIVEAMGQSPSPALSIALIPAAFADLTVFMIACVFTLGTAPGCEDLDEEEGSVRLRLSGPFQLDQSSVVHHSTGLLLSSEGTASAVFKGSFPKPPPGRRISRNAAKIAGTPIELAFSFQFREELQGEWPRDEMPWLPYAATALAVLVGAGLVWLLVRRRMRGTSPSVS